MGDTETHIPSGAISASRGGLTRRVFRPILIGLVVVAAAAAVIIRLPLNDAVETDLKTAIVGYETTRQVAWPATWPITLPLTDAEQAELADDLERGLSAYAAEDALAAFDAQRAVRDFAEAAVLDQPWVVTKWDGEVVYFDFVRQTLRGDVIVRAAVQRAHQIGRTNAQKQGVFARRWKRDDGADIFEYRLRRIDGEWKVVAAEHWGVYGVHGEVVVGGPERF